MRAGGATSADAATASFTSPPGTTATASVAGSFLAPAPAMILRPPWLVAIAAR